MRFQAQHPKDQGVTGPYTYGKGRKHIDHTASSNRSLCVKTLQLLNMVEVASYRTPNPVHHITFKDKAAPPTDWSQFVLDPLIMQQFYQHLSHTAIEDPLKIAALVRSFLPLPEPLPPTQKTPVPDPIRFQRLDHTFTRAQWLPSVNSCRSKLHTGFPTDHYLLVTEVQIKLAQRSKPSTPKPKLNLSNPTETQKHDFKSGFEGYPGPHRSNPRTALTTPQNYLLHRWFGQQRQMLSHHPSRLGLVCPTGRGLAGSERTSYHLARPHRIYRGHGRFKQYRGTYSHSRGTPFRR